MRILLLEDNPTVAKHTRRVLIDEGFDVEVASTYQAAWTQTQSNPYDLLLVDILLPDGDGMDLCRRLRAQGSTTPLIFVSGLSDTSIVIEGLNAGAQDYVRKPFEMQELVARVRAQCGRPVPFPGKP